jgi:hypothetical protein
MYVSTTSLCAGGAVLVVADVANVGQAPAANVTVGLFVQSGPGGFALVEGSSPTSPVNLPGGSHVILTWTFSGASLGSVILTTTVTANDGNAGWVVSSGPVVTPPIVIVEGALAAALSAPVSVLPGQFFAVSLTVTNVGDADVEGVVPGIVVTSGASLVTGPTGPVPTGPVTLTPGGSQTFVWTYEATGTGEVTVTAEAGGTTCGDHPVRAGGSTTVIESAVIVLLRRSNP